MSASNFGYVDEKTMQKILSKSRYGNFQLTEAIRVFNENGNVPSQGFKRDIYHKKGEKPSQVLVISLSQENLFDTFLKFLDLIDETPDVVLETSHYRGHREPYRLYREALDLPILKSHLDVYRDKFLEDGCAGISIYKPSKKLEIQFDEHKLIYVYSDRLKRLQPFEGILFDLGIIRSVSIKFVTEGRHVHLSSHELKAEFDEFCQNLGVDPEDQDLC